MLRDGAELWQVVDPDFKERRRRAHPGFVAAIAASVAMHCGRPGSAAVKLGDKGTGILQYDLCLRASWRSHEGQKEGPDVRLAGVLRFDCSLEGRSVWTARFPRSVPLYHRMANRSIF